MSIRLEEKDLANTQQMEVVVNGPDGATHLIMCTGIIDLGEAHPEEYIFWVGPSLSPRQFVGVVTSGSFSHFQISENSLAGTSGLSGLEARLISILAEYDDERGHVKVRARVSTNHPALKLAISYTVNILAEMTIAPHMAELRGC